MILSIDTGLNNFGYAIIDKQTKNIHTVGLIQTKKSKDKTITVAHDYANRIQHITSELIAIIDNYPIDTIVGELPHLGTQSAGAALSLATGVSIAIAVAVSRGINCIWVSPWELKKVFTGKTNAEKTDIMQKCCKVHNWPITYKDIRGKKTGKVIRTDATYHVLDQKYGANKFEHIADAIAAYHTYKQIGGYQVNA